MEEVCLLVLLFAEYRCLQLQPFKEQCTSFLPVPRSSSKVFYKPVRMVAQQTVEVSLTQITQMELLVFQH